MLNYFKSFIRPVIVEDEGKITVIIRGIWFQAANWDVSRLNYKRLTNVLTNKHLNKHFSVRATVNNTNSYFFEALV